MTAMAIWIFNLILWLIIGGSKMATRDADTDYAVCWFCLILSTIANILHYVQ